MFTEIFEDGRFRMKFNGYPDDMDVWEIVDVVRRTCGGSRMWVPASKR